MRSGLVSLVLMGSMGCAADVPELPVDQLFRISHTPEVVMRSPEAHLREVRILGSLDGDLSFGYVRFVAHQADRFIGIVDPQRCGILLLDYGTTELVSELGGCGEGPGEFSNRISELVMWSDSLAVLQENPSQLIRFDMTGDELGRTRLDAAGGRVGITGLTFLSDSLIAMAGGGLKNGFGRFYDGDRLALTYNTRLGAISDTFLIDSEHSQNNPAPAARAVQACSRGNRMAVLNAWQFEGAVFELPDIAVVDHFWLPDDSIRPIPTADTEGWIWSSVPSIACSDEFVAYKHTRLDPETNEWGGGRLLVRTYDGETLLDSAFTSSDSLLTGWIFGGPGNRFFVASNGAYAGYPVVAELELVADH